MATLGVFLNEIQPNPFHMESEPGMFLYKGQISLNKPRWDIQAYHLDFTDLNSKDVYILSESSQTTDQENYILFN